MNIFEMFNNNSFLSSGLILMFIGSLMAYFKSLPGNIYHFLERFFIVRIEVLDSDESFQWIQLWISENLKNALSVSVVTKREIDNDYDEPVVKSKNKPQFTLIPATGTYFFWYKHRFVMFSRDRQENKVGALDAKIAQHYKETFNFTIFTRNRKIAQEFVEECREKSLTDSSKIEIFVNHYSEWKKSGEISSRLPESLILEGNQLEKLTEDIKDFLQSKEWYESRGIPYRRNYLLYGIAGSGKTSLIKVIASIFNMNIYVLSIGASNLSDVALEDLMSSVPDGDILLLEDIDCAFEKRKKKEINSPITMSGLLNSIDGVSSKDNRLIFMTTNHIENLDTALLRCGRTDLKLEFTYSTKNQAKRLFEKFYPEHNHLSQEFADNILENTYSVSHLQEILLRCRKDPSQTITFLKENNNAKT